MIASLPLTLSLWSFQTRYSFVWVFTSSECLVSTCWPVTGYATETVMPAGLVGSAAGREHTVHGPPTRPFWSGSESGRLAMPRGSPRGTLASDLREKYRTVMVGVFRISRADA